MKPYKRQLDPVVIVRHHEFHAAETPLAQTLQEVLRIIQDALCKSHHRI